MGVYFARLGKPLIVAALVGLVAVHWLTPLTSATVAVAVLWALSMLFV